MCNLQMKQVELKVGLWIVDGSDNDEKVAQDSTTGADDNEGELVGLPRVGSRRTVRQLNEIILSLKMKWTKTSYF